MGDSAVSALTYKLHNGTVNFPYTFLRARRSFSRTFMRTFYSLLTNTQVEGVENIPAAGPLLVLPNHLSNLDGPLVLSMYPHTLEMVGPRDFKMEPFKTMMMSVYGMTLINRGYTDSNAVSNIITHLRNKKHLLLFPSGGMWEKRSFQNKQGAAYFSQLTQTPILPVGISGAYLQSHRTLTMHKPNLVLRFGKVLDPISKQGSKFEREEQLQKGNRSLEAEMFNLLEADEQERYRRWEREIYSLEIRFKTNREVQLITHYSQGAFPRLAEFCSKPNLFRPMWRHAKKNMDPFLTGRVSPVEQVRAAAQDLLENLTQEFSQYLRYRLGEDAHEQTIREIGELQQVCEAAANAGAEIQLVPTAYDPLTRSIRTKPLV
jgi:1-acyl-sn-glycerol-3-phosphate acyltransferase